MELRLHQHDWAYRRPDWTVAAVAGFAASAVMMVLELLWAATMSNAGPWRTSQLVAALLLGPGTLQASALSFDAGVAAIALATHYALGIVFGMILGFIIAGFHYETSVGMMQTIGAVFGVLLYFFNFYGVTELFPWFAEMRGWATLMSHLVFGIVAALLYWKLARRGVGPQPTG